MHRILGLLAALGLAAAIAPASAAPATGGAGGPPIVGELAPPVGGQRVSGSDPVTLRGLEGRVVLLDFWATWCGPCRAVMPRLDDLHRRYHGSGLTVLGLSAEGNRVIRRHLARFPVGYTVAGEAMDAHLRYRVRGIPALYVVDRTGKLRFASEGVDGAVLRRVETLVQRLLAEP